MASRAKKKRIQIMEEQDAKGISRKKWKFTISPTLFIIIKLILIILIPIVYFVYSPLLILVMIAYVSLFFLARFAEHSLNKSVIRANHIHIMKFDSFIALLVIIIAFAGSFSSINNKNKQSAFGGFNSTQVSEMLGNKSVRNIKKSNKTSQVQTYFTNFFTLLTGERNVFESNEKEFNFGTMKPPSDFVANKEDLENKMDKEMGGRPKGGGGYKMSIDDIPLEYVTSSTISTINMFLIFSVSGVGLISLICIYLKKKKFEREMEEVVIEGKIEMLSSGELEKILSFGEDVINENTNNSGELNSN